MTLNRVAVLSWVLAVVLWVLLFMWRAWLERSTFKRVVPDRVFVAWPRA